VLFLHFTYVCLSIAHCVSVSLAVSLHIVLLINRVITFIIKLCQFVSAVGFY